MHRVFLKMNSAMHRVSTSNAPRLYNPTPRVCIIVGVPAHGIFRVPGRWVEMRSIASLQPAPRISQKCR